MDALASRFNLSHASCNLIISLLDKAFLGHIATEQFLWHTTVMSDADYLDRHSHTAYILWTFPKQGVHNHGNVFVFAMHTEFAPLFCNFGWQQSKYINTQLAHSLFILAAQIQRSTQMSKQCQKNQAQSNRTIHFKSLIWATCIIAS